MMMMFTVTSVYLVKNTMCLEYNKAFTLKRYLKLNAIKDRVMEHLDSVKTSSS